MPLRVARVKEAPERATTDHAAVVDQECRELRRCFVRLDRNVVSDRSSRTVEQRSLTTCVKERGLKRKTYAGTHDAAAVKQECKQMKQCFVRLERNVVYDTSSRTDERGFATCVKEGGLKRKTYAGTHNAAAVKRECKQMKQCFVRLKRNVVYDTSSKTDERGLATCVKKGGKKRETHAGIHDAAAVKQECKQMRQCSVRLERNVVYDTSSRTMNERGLATCAKKGGMKRETDAGTHNASTLALFGAGACGQQRVALRECCVSVARLSPTPRAPVCSTTRSPTHADSRITNTSPLRDKVETHVSNVCGKTFEQEHHLSSHIQDHQRKKASKLTERDEIVEKVLHKQEQSESKTAGVSEELAQVSNSPKSKKSYTCKVCQEQFAQLNHYELHKRIHTGLKVYTCQLCEKKFPRPSKLEAHMRVHTNERPYPCEICGKQFKNGNNLKSHQLIHTGEKRYACDICDKKFAQPSRLYVHRLVHTRDDSYSCTTCKQKYKKLSDYRIHQIMHAGRKIYSCEVCEKKFIREDNLEKHKRGHTGENPYSCDICKKQFTQIDHLNTHKLIHTNKNKKPFSCKVCKKQFRDLTALNNHTRIHTALVTSHMLAIYVKNRFLIRML